MAGMDFGATLFQQVQGLPFEADVSAALAEARASRLVPRLWSRDATLWTGQDEANWLGWLEAPRVWRAQMAEWGSLAETAKRAGIRAFVLAGMGGSSLCPIVWERTFPPDGVLLRVVDSTVPEQIRRRLDGLEWPITWAGVSSKSGSTAETVALSKLLRARIEAAVGVGWGQHFIAITDPGTRLEADAAQHSFRYCALGDPAVGGRFAAFTPYGLLPGILHGAPVAEIVDGAEEAMERCRAEDEQQNPGLLLGIVLGVAARSGRNKLTLLSSASLDALPLWVEQLIAESTGKNGVGIVPVAHEPIGPPTSYSDDRLFVYLRDAEAPDRAQDAAVQRLLEHGHPVLCLAFDGARSIGRWMYTWEFATAVAGSLLGVHPFDQPNVELTKQKTRELLDRFREGGTLELPAWSRRVGDLALYVSEAAEQISKPLREGGLSAGLEAFVALARSGASYVAINAFLAEDSDLVAEIAWLRRIFRDATGCAVPFGWGPRYLHSTGQLHKGGPPDGIFLFLTAQDGEDLPVPGELYSFGVLKQAQVFGDIRALEELGRTVLCVDLGPDPLAGLARLRIALEEAVGLNT